MLEAPKAPFSRKRIAKNEFFTNNFISKHVAMNSSALLPNSCATYSAQLRSFIYMSMGHHGLATSESTFPMLRTNFWTTWLRILKSCVSQRLIYSKIIVHCQHHLIWAWCFTMFQSYFRHWPPCLMCVEVRPWSDSSRVVLCVRGSLRAGQRDYVQNHCFAIRVFVSKKGCNDKIWQRLHWSKVSWPAKTWSHCVFACGC